MWASGKRTMMARTAPLLISASPSALGAITRTRRGGSRRSDSRIAVTPRAEANTRAAAMVAPAGTLTPRDSNGSIRGPATQRYNDARATAASRARSAPARGAMAVRDGNHLRHRRHGRRAGLPAAGQTADRRRGPDRPPRSGQPDRPDPARAARGGMRFPGAPL